MRILIPLLMQKHVEQYFRKPQLISKRMIIVGERKTLVFICTEYHISMIIAHFLNLKKFYTILVISKINVYKLLKTCIAFNRPWLIQKID